jgi:DGQHR domain-containing protein
MDQTNVRELEQQGWKKYRVIKAHQPGGTVYQIAILGKDLVSNAVVLKRGADSEGIQRVRRSAWVRRISKFYASGDVLLPNNIIGNLKPEDVFIEGDHAYIRPSIIAEIIDGQHRLWGFHSDFNEADANFEIFFAFVIGADTPKKAKLFYKINKEQKKINPSLAFDLLSVINEGGLDQDVVDVVKWLNTESQSPFYGMIKMNETDEGILSLANMMTTVKDFLKTPLGRSFVRDEQVERDQLCILLRNYFLAVKELQPEEWGGEDSILTKTLGIGAFFQLMNDVLNEFIRKEGWRLPKVVELVEIMKPLEGFDFNSEDIRGLGGKKGQNVLADKLRDELGTGKFQVMVEG